MSVNIKVQSHIYGDVKSRKISGCASIYEGWNFNSGNYLFTTDTK